MKRMRRRDREVTDEKEIQEILDEGKVLHIGMHDGDGIYILPMNYGYVIEDGRLIFYLHGSLEGKKWDLLRKNGNVFVEMDCDHEPIPGR